MQVNNLKAYLANIGLTMRAFCEILDTDDVYMSSIVNGKRKPGARLAKDICNATNGLIRFETTPRKKNKNRDQNQSKGQDVRAI